MLELVLTPALEFLRTMDVQRLNFKDVIQVLIIIALFVVLYKNFIKNTASERLVKGILTFFFLFWFASEILNFLNLQILGMFLRGLIFIVILGLVVIFQPELRKFLGHLGQSGFLSKNYYLTKRQKHKPKINAVKEILEAIKHLKKNKMGALMVLQKGQKDTSEFEVRTKIDALLSTELILTIFHPNTPLHDGAVILNEDRILAAGVLLPLTEDPKLSWRYGTRHRAAIGLSEVTDHACIVVSEETGDVSIAVDGMLKKYDDVTVLKSDLEKLLEYKEEEQPKQVQTEKYANVKPAKDKE